jgi:hypothetical protein
VAGRSGAAVGTPRDHEDPAGVDPVRVGDVVGPGDIPEPLGITVIAVRNRRQGVARYDRVQNGPVGSAECGAAEAHSHALHVNQIVGTKEAERELLRFGFRDLRVRFAAR